METDITTTPNRTPRTPQASPVAETSDTSTTSHRQPKAKAHSPHSASLLDVTGNSNMTYTKQSNLSVAPSPSVAPTQSKMSVSTVVTQLHGAPSKYSNSTEESDVDIHDPKNFKTVINIYEMKPLDDPPSIDALEPGMSLSLVTDAMKRILANKTDVSIQTELENMGMVVEDTIRKAILQNKLLKKYSVRVDDLKYAIKNDPRVKKSLCIAQHHRNDTMEMESHIDELKDTIADKDETIEKLEDTIRSLNVEVKNSAGRLKSCGERVAECQYCQEQLGNIMAERHQLKLAYKTLEDDNAAHLEGVHQQYKDKITDLKESGGYQVEGARKIIEARNHQIQRQEKIITDINNKNLEVEAARLIAAHNITVLERSLVDTRADNRRKHDTIIHLEEEKVNLERRVGALTQIGEQQLKSIKMLKEIGEDRKIQLDENDKELRKNRRVIALKAANVQVLDKQLKQQNQQINTLMTERAIHVKTFENMREKIKTIEKDLKSMQDTCDIMSSKFNKALFEGKSKTEQIKEFERQLHINAEFIDNLTMENFIKESLKKTMERDLKKLIYIVIEANKTISDYDKQYEQLTTDMFTLEKDQARLQRELAEKTILAAETKQKNVKLQTQALCLRDDMSLLQRNALILRNEIRTCGHEVDIAEKEIKRQDVEITSRDNNLHQIVSQNNRMAETMVELRRDLQAEKKLHVKVSKELDKTRDDLKVQELHLAQLEHQRSHFVAMAEQRKVERELLEERMRIMEKKLEDNAALFRNKENDVRVLVLEVRNLRSKLRHHDENVTKLNQLRDRHANVLRSLQQLQSRQAAMETANPRNIHGLRFLEASNPSCYELYLKVQILTRRLIKKTVEVTEKEEILVQRNKVYLEMKTLLARRGPTDASRKVVEQKTTINRKNNQIKALKAELAMNEFNSEQAQQKCNEKTNELKTAKQQCMLQKKIINRQRPFVQKTKQTPQTQQQDPKNRKVGFSGYKKLPPVRCSATRKHTRTE